MKRTTVFKGSVLLLLLTVAGISAFGFPRVSSTPRQQMLNSRLLAAIQRRNTRAVRALLHQGANPNVQFSTDAFASFISSSPVRSIRQDALGMALNVYDVHNECPNIDIVTVLLEYGALLTHGSRRHFVVHKGRFHHADREEYAYYVDIYFVDTSLKSPDGENVDEGFVGSRRQLDRLLRAAVKAGALRY